MISKFKLKQMRSDTKKILTVSLILILIITTFGISSFLYLNRNMYLDTDANFDYDKYVQLNVDVTKKSNPFTSDHLGISIYGGLGDNVSIEGVTLKNEKHNEIIKILKEINPGIIRYATGDHEQTATRIINSSTTQEENFGGWNTNPKSGNNGKLWVYNSTVLDSLHNISKNTNSKIMIQANVHDENFEQWNSMFNYVNSNGLFDRDRFKNYQITSINLGAKVDSEVKLNDSSSKISSEAYKYKSEYYAKELNKVSKNLEVNVGNVRDFFERDSNGNQTKNLSPYLKSFIGTSEKLNFGLTFPSEFQLKNINKYAPNITKILKDEKVITSEETKVGIIDFNHILPSGHEYNSNGYGQHFKSLAVADILPWMASNGIDYSTAGIGYLNLIQREDNLEYANTFSMLDQNNINSLYYIYYLYNKNFIGDLVDTKIENTKVNSNNAENISIWASQSKDNPKELNLMIINYSSKNEDVVIKTPNFGTKGGSYYQFIPDSIPNNTQDLLLKSTIKSSIDGNKLTPKNFEKDLEKIKPKDLNLDKNTSAFVFNLQGYSVTSLKLFKSDEILTPTEDDKPTVTEDDKPTATEDDKPTATEDNKPTVTEDNKPTATEDYKPTVTEDNKPTATEDNKPTTTESNKPSATKDNPTSTQDNKTANGSPTKSSSSGQSNPATITTPSQTIINSITTTPSNNSTPTTINSNDENLTPTRTPSNEENIEDQKSGWSNLWWLVIPCLLLISLVCIWAALKIRENRYAEIR